MPDDRLLLALLRLLAPRARCVEQHARGRVRARTGSSTADAGGLEQRLAPLGGSGVEQPPRAVEPARGGAGERAPPRRSARAPAPRSTRARPLGEPAERHELAAGEDRRRQRAELGRDEDDRRVRRRLLEILEQRVGGVLVHPMRVEDEVDAASRLERPHVQVVAQRADVVDADHLAERLEHVEVGMRARLDAARVAEQRGGERERGRSLPDPGGPCSR